MLKFFRIPFALSGDKAAVPDTVDAVTGSVSYPEGFGFNYQRDFATDPLALNIPRDQSNQIYFDITNAVAELQAQGVPDFITSALNGGTAYSYAAGAIVRYSGDLYLSLEGSNTALPSDATKWALLPTPARLQSAFNTQATAAGTVDALTAAFTPVIAALPAAPGTLSVLVRAAGANLTTAPTFKADGTAAKTIVKGANSPLAAGDIAGAGHWLRLDYDAVLDKWVLQNPVTSGVTPGNLQTQAYTAFTSGGSAPAFTLSPTPAITGYSANQRFRVAFAASGTTGSNTLNVSTLGVKNLKQYDQTGAKVPAVVASGQLADIEYDGTDFVILNPLPSTVGAPLPVRQTTLSGPVDSDGKPSFLPATSGTLSLTSQNIASGAAALIVGAANGFTQTGAVDRVGYATANLTWAGLTANATNYLYVDVASDGTLTAGSTTLAPAYQQGGARSSTNGQATYNIAEAYLTVGNGSAAVQTYRVYVGEAVTGASSVTSSVAYAYQGAFISPWTSTLPSAAALLVVNHNIGSDLVSTEWEVENITPEFNYTAGMRVKNPSQGSTYWMGAMWRQGRNTTTCRGGNTAFCQVVDATSGVMSTPTSASWKYRVFVKRDW